MSVYIVAKVEYIIKTFASGLFTVRVGVFPFTAINLLNMAVKSNFKGQAYASSSIVGNIIAKIYSKTVGIF